MEEGQEVEILEVTDTESQEAVVEEVETEEVAASDPAEVEEVEEDAPVVDKVQKRINEITAQKYEAAREAEYWKNKALQAKQEEPAPVHQPTQQQLSPEQFDTYEEYTAAVAHQAGQQAVAQYQAQQVREQQHKTIKENVAKAKEKYTDFDTVLNNPSVPSLSPNLQTALVSSPDFGDIAYHLARNPAKVKELNNMHPLQAVMELGTIVHQIKTAPAPKTNAPPPPNKVTKGSGVIPKNPATMSDAEYREWSRQNRSS